MPPDWLRLRLLWWVAWIGFGLLGFGCFAVSSQVQALIGSIGKDMTRNDEETNRSALGVFGLPSPANSRYQYFSVDRSAEFTCFAAPSVAMVGTATTRPSTAPHAVDHGPWLHLMGSSCTYVLGANKSNRTSAQFCEHTSLCTNVLAADAHVPRQV